MFNALKMNEKKKEENKSKRKQTAGFILNPEI